MLDVVKEEVYSIRMCEECYVNMSSKQFEMVCKQPHLLVWAKTKTYPHWPAKLMSVNTVAKTVDVRYFGGKHYRAVLSAKECFMYSQSNPGFQLGSYRQSMAEAQKVHFEAI